MSRPMSTSELIKDYVGRQLNAFRVSFPATVQKYDPLTQIAEVMPDADWLISTGKYVAAKPIADVPVCFPVGGGWEITWDLVRGDKVDCIVNDHSLSDWKVSGSSRPMQLKDPHSIGQIKAYPNLATRTNPRKQAGRGLYIGRSDGSVAIELTKTGKVKIGNQLVDLLGLFDQVITLFNQTLAAIALLKMSGVTTGSGVSGVGTPETLGAFTEIGGQLAAVQAQLEVIKGA